jgi:uncharacterized small protein (DUF1192 family)
MPRRKTKTIEAAPSKYSRRPDEERIAQLEARIQRLKAKARAKKDPSLRYVSKAVKAIDAAVAQSSDAALRTAHQEARHTLGACLRLQGLAVPRHGQGGAPVIEAHPRRRG